MAQLYSWGARALYLGPALGLTPHRNAAVVLAVGVEAPFRLALNADVPAPRYRECRTAIIPPDIVHHLTGTSGVMGFVYVDARSGDYARLLAEANGRESPVSLSSELETRVIALFAQLHAQAADAWPAVREQLQQILYPRTRDVPDPRITRVLELIHAEPAARHSLANLAQGVGLSDSRLLHLFKERTGVPLRRYKLWVAMGAAIRAITAGASLTTAGIDAGFSSSSHFSAAFRDMFGMEPSRLGNLH